MRDHELRSVLNDELHGRPGLPVVAPARITHLAFTLSEGDGDPLAHVRLLCDALGVKPPPPVPPTMPPTLPGASSSMSATVNSTG